MLFENIIIYTDLGPGTLVCKLAPHSSRARSQGEQVFFSQKVHLMQSSSNKHFSLSSVAHSRIPTRKVCHSRRQHLFQQGYS